MRDLLQTRVYGTELWLLLPFVIIALLICLAALAFIYQDRSRADKGKDTTLHSERIYKDFEMYLKINLGLTAALGYINVNEFKTATSWELETIQLAIGAISLLTMTTFSLFIISHQASKIRRWWNVEWWSFFYWQEFWACCSIWAFSTGVWLFCWRTI